MKCFFGPALRIPATAPRTGGTPLPATNPVYRTSVPGPFHTDIETIRSSETSMGDQVVFGEYGEFEYWLAYRATFASTMVLFSVGGVDWGEAGSGTWYLFGSSQSSWEGSISHASGVRPVITLNANAQWVEDTAGTSANPHRIR